MTENCKEEPEMDGGDEDIVTYEGHDTSQYLSKNDLDEGRHAHISQQDIFGGVNFSAIRTKPKRPVQNKRKISVCVDISTT